jgi:membrane-bound lytic murein transglycosylase MltF
MAQGNLPKPTVSDPFAGLHDALSSAADSLLAATAQRRPEIAGDNSTEKGTGRKAAFQSADSPQRGKQAFVRVQQLRPVLEPILREEGVPAELAAVVLVESGGQPAALSPKGARGIWQLMPDTARRYGLIVTRVRDDRTDPEKSTRAAARYLRDLYARFGDWSLALAAYNAGELLVENAINWTGTTDFAGLSREGRIPNETRNYVPAVWAAVERLGNLSEPTNRMTRKAAGIVYAFAQLQN